MSERLEKIKILEEALKYQDSETGEWFINIDYESFKHLREHAERVEELGKELSEWQDLHKADTIKLDNQNKRYREALEFYADDYIWHEENMGSDYLPDYRCEAQSDGGKKARKALESEPHA